MLCTVTKINYSTRVFTECQIAPQYPKPLEVKGLSVDFTSKKPQVEITWQAIDPLKTGMRVSVSESVCVIFSYTQ